MVTMNAAARLGATSCSARSRWARRPTSWSSAATPHAVRRAPRCHARDVRLVVVGGVALYGEPALKPLGPASPGCEDMSVCGQGKFICVAAPSQSTTDKFDQTLSTITSALQAGLQAYDALALSQWLFAPLTPVVRCN